MTSPSFPDPPAEIEGFAELRALALDLRWSWNHSTDELRGRIDPELWALTHNPWVVLQTASRTRLAFLTPFEQERVFGNNALSVWPALAA